MPTEKNSIMSPDFSQSPWSSLFLQERRRSPRYCAPEWLVAGGKFPGGREHRLRVLNISVDGLCFATDFDISRESVFVISFDPAGEGQPAAPIVTPAKIIWYTRDGHSGLYNCGVQFLCLKDEQKEMLKQALSAMAPM